MSHVVYESSRNNKARNSCILAERCVCSLTPPCRPDLRIPDERIRQLIKEGILRGSRDFKTSRGGKRSKTESEIEDEKGEEDDIE